MSCATRFLVLLAAPLPPRFPSFLRLSRLHRLHLRQRRLHSLSSLALHHYHTLGSSPHHSSPLRIEACSSAQFHAQSDAVDEDHLVHPVDSNSWPEWTNLVGILSSSGYFVERNGFGAPVAQGIGGDDEFVAGVDLQEEFIRAARACLAFARDRPQLLRTLAKRDIDVLVQNGSPFLFNNADDSIQKMRSFVNGTEGTIIDGDKAQTVDLMRFILSYASNPAMLEKSFSSFSNLYVVASVRNLLREMANLSYAAPQSNSARSVESLLAGEYGQTPRPLGQNIEMKRGDWICPRCNFMNFARNMKCLECEVVRPKRQLTGAEWECPQCDFVNYGRNVVCLRCECKRPGETSPRVPSGFGWVPGSSSNDADNSDIDRRLAVNEEKAQRWFNKVSQLDSTSDIKNAIADEDFPEIMPLRKGVNRFVVSTKKTPLERRLANDQPRSGLTANGTPDFDDDRSWDVNKMPNSPVNQRLGGISGCKSVDSGSSGSPSFSNSSPPQLGHRGGNNSGYVPFVPLPADMFAKKPVSSKTEVGTIVTGGSPTDKEQGYAVSGSNISGESETALQPAEQPVIQTDSQERDRGEEKSDGWFKRVTKLHDSRDLPSASSGEDFHERMPMRKGDNRFVVGRAKDRSLTSPLYKRRAALEQSSSANFVPFVPFPPGYFAKKENERSSGENPNDNAAFEAKSTLAAPEKLQEGAVESRSNVSNSSVPPTETHQFNTGNCNAKPPAKKATQNNSMVNFGLPDAGMPQDSGNQQMGRGSSVGAGSYHGSRSTSNASNLVGSSRQPSEIFNVREQWSGKSLEGSAVKEPDPLDMSEEAKAERWFRRVAQIKDISELSQIPDEDFPSIMPMRKGVNRFVVSKRKTPLERRLTSPQYRRNLPVVNSDTTKGEDENK